RPREFRTSAGSGQAYEILRRASPARPVNVTGGTPTAANPSPPAQDSADFDFVESPTLTRLQGEWSAVKIVRDGQELPRMMLGNGLRSATKNEIKISFGGQSMIHALVRLNEDTSPMHVDYYNLAGVKGSTQLGIMQWIGDEACFCMAAPG